MRIAAGEKVTFTGALVGQNVRFGRRSAIVTLKAGKIVKEGPGE